MEIHRWILQQTIIISINYIDTIIILSRKMEGTVTMIEKDDDSFYNLLWLYYHLYFIKLLIWFNIYHYHRQNKLNTKDKEIQQREKVLKSKATKAENTELALLNSNKNEKPVRRLSFRFVMLNIFLFCKYIFFFNFYFSIYIE